MMTINRNGQSRWHLALCAAMSASLLLSGCDDGDDDDDNEAQVAKPKPDKKAEGAKDAKGEAQAAVDEERGEIEEERMAYSYNPIGKRDPFKSFIVAAQASPDAPIETPLQKYEIDQYKLKAIIWGVDSPVAMVEDPAKMGHFLQKDTLIGKNWGKVVRITPTEVIVAEEYRDPEGKLIVNEIPLRLPVQKDIEVR